MQRADNSHPPDRVRDDGPHDIRAARLVPGLPPGRRILAAQRLGGDIVYIASQNSVFAGPNNLAYCATKADQAHQVRLLAADSADTASGSTASTRHGPRLRDLRRRLGAQRAATYGVEEADLGEFYAQRTTLKREVLPGHAAAVFALVGGELSHTGGLYEHAVATVAAAFLP